MKRPDEDDERHASADSKAEEFLTGFFRKYPRFLLYVGIGIAVLILVALVLAKSPGSN
jgi:hypothetical protein